jgi:glyoxylase-like metal-dependent hydrolase (beta-lactamase superfamily II)
VNHVDEVDAIVILQPGSLSIEHGEHPDAKTRSLKKLLGVCGESSMVLIESRSSVVLVDTGFRNEMDASAKNLELNKRHVDAALSLHGHNTSDVDEVFITHWHHDHIGNIGLFPSAVVRYAGISDEEVRFLAGFLGIKNATRRLDPGAEWVPGASAFATPGHNDHHHSVLVNYKGLAIVAAGDAIVSQSYYDHDAVWTHNGDFMSEKMAVESMARITGLADLIIPGHGHPFQSYKRATPGDY